MDIRQTLECCHKFDTEAGIGSKAEFAALYAKVPFFVLLLWQTLSERRHMYARCSGTHERQVPVDFKRYSDMDSTNMSDVIRIISVTPTTVARAATVRGLTENSQKCWKRTANA